MSSPYRVPPKQGPSVLEALPVQWYLSPLRLVLWYLWRRPLRDDRRRVRAEQAREDELAEKFGVRMMWM